MQQACVRHPAGPPLHHGGPPPTSASPLPRPPSTAPLQAVEAAAESKLMGLLYQREARTGTELAGRIMILKERIERLQDARRTLDALTLEGGWAAPAVQPPHGL